MIISWLCGRLEKEDRDSFQIAVYLGAVFGLALGLAIIWWLPEIQASSGTKLGLTNVLFMGLVLAVISYVFMGIAVEAKVKPILLGCFTSATIMGLVIGLSMGLLPFSWMTVIILILVEEVLYWLDNEKMPPNEDRTLFTIWKKIEALTEIGFGAGVYVYIYDLITRGPRIVNALLSALLVLGEALSISATYLWNAIQSVALTFLLVVGVIGFLALFIYLNSLKYPKRKPLVDGASESKQT
jgi:hypothetical protein